MRNGIPQSEVSHGIDPYTDTVMRVFLYVPADRLDTLWDSAIASRPDTVILDLEDGVAPSAKTIARENLVRRLRQGTENVAVRINSGDLAHVDLDVLDEFPSVPIVLPKADLAALANVEGRLLERNVIGLIESATGLLDVVAIARHPSVIRLAIGEADLRADLGLGVHADHVLWPLRAQLVVASRAADIEPPIGPVSTDWRDLDDLRRSSVLLRNAGFAGRSTIHPSQVAVVTEVFAPTADELARARRVIELFDAAVATGQGVCVGDDGRMIDEAVVRSARRVLS